MSETNVKMVAWSTFPHLQRLRVSVRMESATQETGPFSHGKEELMVSKLQVI
jgi:hypothetical protein